MFRIVVKLARPMRYIALLMLDLKLLFRLKVKPFFEIQIFSTRFTYKVISKSSYLVEKCRSLTVVLCNSI